MNLYIECDTCKRRAIWQVSPACACSLPDRGGRARLRYYACMQHIGQVIRLYTYQHGIPHFGKSAVEMTISELPKE